LDNSAVLVGYSGLKLSARLDVAGFDRRCMTRGDARQAEITFGFARIPGVPPPFSVPSRVSEVSTATVQVSTEHNQSTSHLRDVTHINSDAS
jgi:hypothetical protein